MHDALALDHYDARGLQLTVLAIEQVCSLEDDWRCGTGGFWRGVGRGGAERERKAENGSENGLVHYSSRLSCLRAV